MVFAIIGSVLLLFGVLGIFTGAAPWLLGAHFALGLGALAYAGLTSMKELRQVFGRGSSRRGLRSGSNALTQTLAVAAILGFTAYIVGQRPVRWDWTEAGVHTLTQATRDVLEQIPEDRPVEVYAFVGAGGGESVRRVLGMYEYASDRFRATYHDPMRRPQLAERFEVDRQGVLIVCGGPCETATGTVRVTEASEQELTRAVRSVLSERKKLYFVTGHGEGTPDDVESSGAARAAMFLGDENIEVAPLLLAQEAEVPADASAVIVVGPSYAFFERETQALDRYLRGGGSLMLLLDPIVSSGLEEPLLGWGIEVGADVIVDETIDLFAGPRLGVQAVVSSYGDHASTEKMEGLATVFRLARSVRPTPEAAGDSVILLQTGERAWAESEVEAFSRSETRVQFDPSQDVAGPVPLGVARVFPVEGADADPDAEGRLIVIGDADFARNGFVGSAANADLLINMVHWLTGEEQFITIDRKLPRASMALLTSGQVATFRYLALFGLPELILLIAIVNWWRRRD
ncbi:MAG: GldG family protein [Deltaproteobacteria bacterium]|nr:GldG family protein [Deltaproteobacteria bacterium]